MKCAKFHLIGEDSDWYKIRVQKEIEAHGLAGNVLDSGEGKLVIVVEGEEAKINSMYNTLKEASPSNVVFSLVEYGRIKKEKTREEEKWDEVTELLREIEKTMRRVNNKLDGLQGVVVNSDEQMEDEPIVSEGEEEAENAFAFMFG